MASEQVAQLTSAQLTDAVGELRALAARLERFCAGDETAWSPVQALSGHQLLALIDGQVGVLRRLRGAQRRRAAVVVLDEHR